MMARTKVISQVAPASEEGVLTQNEFRQPFYDERNGVELKLQVGFREFLIDADNVGQWQFGGGPVGTLCVYSRKRRITAKLRQEVFELVR